MLYTFAYNLAVKLERNSLIHVDDIDYCRYGIEMFILTVFKTTILLTLAVIAGLTKEVIIYMIAFSSLRIQAGGIHADSIILCLTITAFTAFISIRLSSMIPVDYALLFQIIAITIAGLLIYLYSPKDTPNKPLSKEEKIIYRRRSICTYIIGSLVILIGSIFINDFYYYSSIASFAFLIESITLTPSVLILTKIGNSIGR